MPEEAVANVWPFSKLPIDVVLLIFQWGALLSHELGLSISRVCKEARKLAFPHVFQTIFISDADYQLLASPNLPYPTLVENLWFDPPTRGQIHCPMYIRGCDFLHQPHLSNIIKIAVSNAFALRALNCDPSTHQGSALSNLASCQYLTFFDFDDVWNFNTPSKISTFVFENITHLQIFWSTFSDRDNHRGMDCMGRIIVLCNALTHLAIDAPELCIQPSLLTRYRDMLADTKKKRARDITAVVLMVDWHRWIGNHPENRQIAWETFFQLVFSATSKTDGYMSIVHWGSSLKSERKWSRSGSSAAAVRALWKHEAVGGETVWELGSRKASYARWLAEESGWVAKF
ncbi:hypothetical protein JAAARDRAFT_41822 [Jaapia argillacea MUCL 33604]|uniref:Uncharacterized protein n=1 Tax=Jaapia argillacea MUCL 33604 TaxID=933084 RepID=A0A067P753_9AGAM|nr:hypothetical protein JAAARDRAFT_41822 [Jaapia argillacea MUCL 33604]